MAVQLLEENEKEALRYIGEEVAKKRGERSQRWLADRVGTTQTSIRRLERGETNVSAILFVRTAKVLEMNILDLLDRIEPEENLVALAFQEHKTFIDERTAAMGLTDEDFHTKRELLRLLKLWPR